MTSTVPQHSQVGRLSLRRRCLIVSWTSAVDVLPSGRATWQGSRAGTLYISFVGDSGRRCLLNCTDEAMTIALDIAPCIGLADEEPRIKYVQHDILGSPLPFEDQAFDFVRMSNVGLTVPGQKSAGSDSPRARVLTLSSTTQRHLGRSLSKKHSAF